MESGCLILVIEPQPSSGDIEQDADVVIQLYRELRTGKDEEPGQDEHILEMHITKNRHGAVGMVETWFAGETMEIQALGRDLQ